MKSIWNKIQNEIYSIDHKSGNSFNKPALNSEINSLKIQFDKDIPNDFIEYLKVYNGQIHNNFEIQPFSYYSFLPINEIINTVKMQKNLWGNKSIIESITENKIKPKIWDKNWLPIASESTSYLILDLNPGRNRILGQVFQLFNGIDYEDNEVVLANSFIDFSKLLMTKLEKKQYEIDEDEPIVIFENDWI